MLKCIRAHEVGGFGLIPVGSLWADDSEFVGDASAFVDLDKPEPVPVKKSAVKKSAAKKGDV